MTLGRFKLTALFKAKTEVVLALCRGRLGNNWSIQNVLKRLLNATFILRCVVHFECSEVEIWFGSTHTSFDVYGISFHFLRRHHACVFVLIRLNIAILESSTGYVITLLRNVRLAELGDERHTLCPSIHVVLSGVIRKVMSSRWLSLPGISIAHVNITLSSFALINLLKCTHIPSLLSHNFVKRSVRVYCFWISICTRIA